MQLVDGNELAGSKATYASRQQALLVHLVPNTVDFVSLPSPFQLHVGHAQLSMLLSSMGGKSESKALIIKRYCRRMPPL